MLNWIRPFAPLLIMVMAGASIVALAVVIRQPTLEATTERSTTEMPTATEVQQAKLPPIDAAAPSETETATFAMGWFWGPDSQFGSLPGVVRTRVGYAGGSKINPTYYSLGDHSETIQIDYDPSQIGYEQLLGLFWSGHRCDYPAYSIQYASRIFYHNEAQKRLAEESKAREEARLGKQLYTSIEPAGTFYRAEDYHQKYRLQGASQLMSELRQIYPVFEHFVDSTLAARLNGYLGGAGTREQLQVELDEYGLSEGAQELLKRIVR